MLFISLQSLKFLKICYHHHYHQQQQQHLVDHCYIKVIESTALTKSPYW